MKNTYRKYWPNVDKKKKYGKIVVQTSSENFYGGYSRTRLNVMKDGSEVSLY